MLSLLYRMLALIPLLRLCYSTFCDSSLLSLTQMVPPFLDYLHKPPSLFNMTLPLDTLTVTGVSLSCRTVTGCGTLSALSLSHPEGQVTLRPSLIHFYISTSWDYSSQFKLYLGPVSAKSLTLSLEFSLSSNSTPLFISSSLFGCEARPEQVPVRQLLQYDLGLSPSPPDPDYTGIADGRVTSGGVGKLTDGDTLVHLEWNSIVAQTLRFLFRFNRAYNLTELELVSSHPPSIEQITLTTRQVNCNVTTNSLGTIAIRLRQCNYLFLSLETPPGPLLLSEIRIRSESGLLSGRNSPNLALAPAGSPSIFNIATLAAVLVTFFLTSLLCLLLLVTSYSCLGRRTGFHRWFSRSRLYRRRGEYMTMKASDKSCSDPSQQHEVDSEHDYATLNLGDLEASSVYVDMSTAADNKPVPNPARAPPPPGASSLYMSMRIRPKSQASTGGFFLRIREKLSQVKNSPPPPPPPSDTQREGTSDGEDSPSGKVSGEILRRGGIKMKSNSGIVTSPTYPPPPPPPCNPSRGCEAESEGLNPAGGNGSKCTISRKGAIKLK